MKRITASEVKSIIIGEYRKEAQWLETFPPTTEYLNGKSPVDIYMEGFLRGAEYLNFALTKDGVIDNSAEVRADILNQERAEMIAFIERVAAWDYACVLRAQEEAFALLKKMKCRI